RRAYALGGAVLAMQDNFAGVAPPPPPPAAAQGQGGALELQPGTPATGKVKAWYDDKGFGFITTDNGGPDVFVHRNQLTDGQNLVQGASVGFEATQKRETYTDRISDPEDTTMSFCELALPGMPYISYADANHLALVSTIHLDIIGDLLASIDPEEDMKPWLWWWWWRLRHGRRTTTGFIWFKWAKSYYDYIPTTSTTTLPSSTTSSPTSSSSSSTTSLYYQPTVSSTTSTTSLTYMNGGDQRGQGQSYGGGLPLSEFNKLVPPGWRPGIPGYPIKLFFERLKLWYRVTDNAEAQLGILVAGRLQGATQKIALRLRLPRPVAAGGGYDIGDEALIRLSQEQVIDPANNTIVQEYIPSGLQFLCQALRAIYGLQNQDRTTVALDSFYEFKRGHLGLAEFAQEFDHRYESAEDEAGLQMNATGKTYFFLRGSGLGDKIIEDIKLQMRGDMSRYQEIRTLVLKLARANDKDKETLNLYQDQTDFNYKVNLDETNGNYYGSWHDPTTGEIIEYDYGANTSDEMYYGDYDCVYDGEYSDYDGAGYDDDWYGDDGWQAEVYHGDFPLEEWTWPASAPDSISVSTAETTLLDVDPSYWKGQTKGKGKGFGAKGKGPSGGSASGIGCATCGSRWHSSLDCPLNDPSKGDQGKGKGGKDYRYENFWKGKGKCKKGGKSKGFGKGWSKGFGKYRPSFGSGKGYGKYSGGYGKSYGKSYGKGKFKGGYGGFRYSSPYNFTAFQDYEVQEAPEHAPTIVFKADGSGTQYYDFEDEKPSSSTSFLVGTCSSAFPTDHEDWSSLYHSVRGVKRHGLLIDPGAASGLIGSDTLKEFRDEILLPLGVDIICRPTTQNVSGISGKPEPALSRVTMPIFPGIKSSTFTADVIGNQGSKCPALLPNPSMRAANMGLLTNFFENGDGMLIVHDNGKRLLYRCLLTESGHYILPTDNVKNNNNVDKEATRKASAFYAAVLHDATQQWSDISSVYLAVDKAAVADPVADRVGGAFELSRRSGAQDLRKLAESRGLPIEVSKVVSAIRGRAASEFDLPTSHVEPLQLVRYSSGEFYAPHVDWGKAEDDTLWLAGQRVATALVYLQGAAGATRFTHLDLRVQPVPGMALLWPNVDARGHPLPETEHEEDLRPLLLERVPDFGTLRVPVQGAIQEPFRRSVRVAPVRGRRRGAFDERLVQDVYQSEGRLDLVMECMSGGELFTRVQKRKRFSEADAATAAYQMLLAINYIHSHDVVHRDIKLENFLYESEESDYLKLIDFGFSKVWKKNTSMQLSCGTLAYVAPDVLMQNYSSQCDLWSLGVSVFIILFGYMPFSGSEDKQINDIKAGRYVVKKQYWERVSDVAQDFVKKLLLVDPLKRLTAEQALQHPFVVRRQAKTEEHLCAATVDALISFGTASSFRRAAMSMMAWSLTNEERSTVRQAFIELDQDNSGTVKLWEFKKVLLAKFHVKSEEAQVIFTALDTNNTDEIHYTEFLAAMVSTRISMHDDLLK
ncbi:unnamed protein product, partial [Polarella glacialis]